MSQPVNGLPINVLDDLVDIDASSPADGQALVWDATAGKWVPASKLDPDGDGSQLTGITTDQIGGLPDALTAATDAAIDAIAADPTIVRTSGSYANPAWITSLAGSKITGNISGNAASITGTIAQSQVTNLPSDLALKAPLASPALTGTPTAPTATAGTSTTQVATTAFVSVVDAAAVHKSGAETIAGVKTFSARSTFAVGLTAPMGPTAQNNEALGAGALVAVSTGVNNTAIGQAAGQSITAGNNNTVVGRAAMASATTGVSSSVAVGYSAEVAKTSGTGTTAVGASTSTAGFTNATALGYQATCTASNQVMLGTSSETVNLPGKAIVAGWLQLGTSTDASIPNGGIAWSLTNPDVLKVRTPSGTLKVVTLT